MWKCTACNTPNTESLNVCHKCGEHRSLKDTDILDTANRIHLSHKEYVRACLANEISVFVNHPAICSLCDSILDYTINSGVAYKSAKLWFWLLPVLSLFSFVVLGPLALIALIVAIGISVFKIGADVRARAFECIVEATVASAVVYENLLGQNILIINRR